MITPGKASTIPEDPPETKHPQQQCKTQCYMLESCRKQSRNPPTATDLWGRGTTGAGLSKTDGSGTCKSASLIQAASAAFPPIIRAPLASNCLQLPFRAIVVPKYLRLSLIAFTALGLTPTCTNSHNGKYELRFLCTLLTVSGNSVLIRQSFSYAKQHDKSDKISSLGDWAVSIIQKN